MDIIEHYIKNSSLVEIPTDFRKLVVEGKENASKVENAICMAFNTEHHGWTNETGPKLAKGWKWLSPSNEKEINAGMSIVSSSKFKSAKLTGPLVQYGSGGGGTSSYKNGDNTTPKTDIHGTGSNQNVSLKLSKAQLASAKAGEAEGVVMAAIQHMENVTGGTFAAVDKVLDVINNKMLKNASNRVFAQVTKSKAVFKDWYASKQNPRWGVVEKQAKAWPELGKKKINDKKIILHLTKELALGGVTTKSTSQNNVLGGVTLPSAKELKVSIDSWTLDQSKVTSHKDGGVLVSQGHLDKRLRNGSTVEDFNKEALTEQIKWILNSSMKHTIWEQELNSAFATNDFLKTAIIYEAASGEYKFTGKHKKDTTSYHSSSNRSVANWMMVFTEDGVCTGSEDMWSWCESHKNLAQQINVSFKGSGTDYYAKLGLRTNLAENKKFLETELGLNKIIEEEYVVLEEELKSLPLSEAFGFLKYVKATAVKLKNYVVDFFKRVFTKVIDTLREWAKLGLEKLAEKLGWELKATCKIGTVS